VAGEPALFRAASSVSSPSSSVPPSTAAPASDLLASRLLPLSLALWLAFVAGRQFTSLPSVSAVEEVPHERGPTTAQTALVSTMVQREQPAAALIADPLQMAQEHVERCTQELATAHSESETARDNIVLAQRQGTPDISALVADATMKLRRVGLAEEALRDAEKQYEKLRDGAIGAGQRGEEAVAELPVLAELGCNNWFV
jgi:hypothetical protein